MDETTELRLLFLASLRFEDGKAIRGAFLLTDQNTKPLEFRCTNPIRPTQLQTILYGSSLQEHMMVQLIGLPLLNSVKEKLHLVLVHEPDFLKVREKVSTPIVRISREGAVAISSEKDITPRLLVSKSGKFDPITLTPHPKFESDREQAKAVLAEVFNSYDLVEPFNRITKALEQVHAQRIGEEK
jgi:hypothetical protein